MSIPLSGNVWLDANALIYSVEQIPIFWPLLRPLWDAQARGAVKLLGSELLITEVLVAPLKTGDRVLVAKYEQAMAAGITLFPIDQTILRHAADLRAQCLLKTPDAIHAAGALVTGCDAFLSNDEGFRGVPGLQLIVLKDLLTPSP